VIGEMNRQLEALEGELASSFEAHPDAEIILSQPGLAVVLGARVLGEFGDDPNRYAATPMLDAARTTPAPRRWALSGFYLALAPSLVGVIEPSHDLLWEAQRSEGLR
jgi:hypothetical protein